MGKEENAQLIEGNEAEDHATDDDSKQKKDKGQRRLSSAELYRLILNNPTYRVCESVGAKDIMRPLEFQCVDAEGRMVFEYDFASTMYAQHALCEDIIDLIGPGDVLGDAPVYCDDWLMEDGVNRTWYTKATVDHGCHWILMHR